VLRKSLLTSLLLLGVLLLPSRTDSATVLKFDTKEMTSRARAIVHGTVETKSSGILPGGRQIYTEYTVRLIDRWKGKGAGDTFTFRQLGGQVGERGYFIAGAASYELGEEIVTFLDRAHPKTGCCFSIGLAQGKYHVQIDKVLDTKMVSRRLEQLELLDRATGLLISPDRLPAKVKKLSALRARVRSFLAESGK